MNKGDTITSKKEKAVLVGVAIGGQSTVKTQEYLDELKFLATTLGVEAKHSIIQKLSHPDPRYYIGSGKLSELRDLIAEENLEIVVFDDDLTPSQLRNLEKDLKVKIYDRSLLILDIFVQRAQTSQAKTQVDLARYQYLLPRLTRMWTHLERQRGGTATRGGAGEKEIETDRRMIRNQISVLKKKLDKIDRESQTRRKSRSKMVRVSLVGYTNTGKSTLMTLLSKTMVKAENKLFATVDSTVRKVVINQMPFLLSDTVGFIRKLPHHLVESFKSTLDEVKEADILLHVADASHPACEEQWKVVNQTLADIGATDKPMITIFNKMDLLAKLNGDEENLINQIRESTTGETKQSIFISATARLNMDALRNVIFREVKKKYIQIYPNYIQNEIYN